MQGSAQFVQAFAPLVEAGAMPLDIAVDIFTGIARVPKLGKQVEDALSRWGQHAAEEAKQPKQPQPDPQVMKVQADAQARQAELQHQITLETTKMRAEQQRKDAEAKHNAQLKEMDLAHNFVLQKAKQDGDMALQHQNHELQRQSQEHELFLKHGEAASKMLLDHAKAKAAAAGKPQDGNGGASRGAASPEFKQHFQELINMMRSGHPDGDVQSALVHLSAMLSSPKEIMRDQYGRAHSVKSSGAERAFEEFQAAMEKSHSSPEVKEAFMQIAEMLVAPKELVRDHAGRAVGVRRGTH